MGKQKFGLTTQNWGFPEKVKLRLKSDFGDELAIKVKLGLKKCDLEKKIKFMLEKKTIKLGLV